MQAMPNNVFTYLFCNIFCIYLKSPGNFTSQPHNIAFVEYQLWSIREKRHPEKKQAIRSSKQLPHWFELHH